MATSAHRPITKAKPSSGGTARMKAETLAKETDGSVAAGAGACVWGRSGGHFGSP
jgi:hypothetical protein